jgi:CTP synthase (UTP-ammonia lyase)
MARQEGRRPDLPGGAIAIVGDFDPTNETHVGTNEAFDHAGARFEWVPTEECADGAEQRVGAYGGILIAPASPYRSMEGALEAIRFARERGVPLVGT